MSKFKSAVDLAKPNHIKYTFNTPWDMHKALWSQAVEKYKQRYDGDYDPERVWFLYATVCQVFKVKPWDYERIEVEGLL